MSVTTAGRRAGSGLHSVLYYKLSHYLVEALCLLLGVVIAVWSLAPIYNMWEIALDSHDDIFAGALWPDHPSHCRCRRERLTTALSFPCRAPG